MMVEVLCLNGAATAKRKKKFFAMVVELSQVARLALLSIQRFVVLETCRVWRLRLELPLRAMALVVEVVLLGLVYREVLVVVVPVVVVVGASLPVAMVLLPVAMVAMVGMVGASLLMAMALLLVMRWKH